MKLTKLIPILFLATTLTFGCSKKNTHSNPYENNPLYTSQITFNYTMGMKKDIKEDDKTRIIKSRLEKIPDPIQKEFTRLKGRVIIIDGDENFNGEYSQKEELTSLQNPGIVLNKNSPKLELLYNNPNYHEAGHMVANLLYLHNPTKENKENFNGKNSENFARIYANYLSGIKTKYRLFGKKTEEDYAKRKESELIKILSGKN